MIDMRHELAKLAVQIDWDFFERERAGLFRSHRGRPATPPRLAAGLLYLQHAFRLSDEAVVARWVETPCYRHVCGETFFQHRPPIDPSCLTRWRKRIGEEGAEWLPTRNAEEKERPRWDVFLTNEAGRPSGAVDDDSLSRGAVDTTVMEKNIAHPTDARRYDKARRQLAAIPEGPFRDRALDMLVLVSRLLHQVPKSRGKIHALHEPEVDRIAKGKARKSYQFGTEVSLTTTVDKGFVVGMHALPGNPHDGHILPEALEQAAILTGQTPALAAADRGYRGHGVSETQVPISGTRRGLTPARKKLLRRRSAIEPEIGHMKTDGRLSRCPLKGTTGDAIFAVPAAAAATSARSLPISGLSRPCCTPQ